jgi:hypothetical protein
LHDENNGYYAFGPKYINDISEFFLICEMFLTNILERIRREVYLQYIFFFENLAVYDVMWKNIVEQDRPQMIV